jgi:hypothetical protein
VALPVGAATSAVGEGVARGVEVLAGEPAARATDAAGAAAAGETADGSVDVAGGGGLVVATAAVATLATAGPAVAAAGS